MSMAVAAVAAFGMLAVTGASASGAATNAPPHPAASAAAAAVPGTQLWMKHYRNVNGSIPYYDNRVWAAASPTGRTVFVTGSSYGGSATDWDYATVAYNADTGKQLWVTRYNGPANRHDFARAITVTPDGSTVFVRPK